MAYVLSIFLIVCVVVLLSVKVKSPLPKLPTSGIVFFKENQIWFSDNSGVYFVKTNWNITLLKACIKRQIISVEVDTEGLVWKNYLCFGRLKRKH